MRPLLAALAVGLSATPALADGELVGRCSSEGPGATVTCPIDLVAGQDYELNGGGDEQSGLVELVNPAGVATVSFHGHRVGDWGVGREFRAAYSATYQIRVTPDEEYGPPYIRASVSTDCRAGVKTRCSLTPGAKTSGASTYRADADWYKATLRKGRTYTFTVGEGGYTRVVLRDGAGTQVARAHSTDSTPGVIRYRAKSDGAHYLEANIGRYTLSVR